MDLPKHEQLFSSARLRRYVSACNGDSNKAINLYKYNIQASQALYSSISTLEVALRNAINKELIKYFKDDQWLLTRRADLTEHSPLAYKDKNGNIPPDNYFNSRLKKAEKLLGFKRMSVIHENLLTELTFRFWVNFLKQGV